eukprot:1039041-Pyramimonas_sp.AAC.1
MRLLALAKENPSSSLVVRLAAGHSKQASARRLYSLYLLQSLSGAITLPPSTRAKYFWTELATAVLDWRGGPSDPFPMGRAPLVNIISRPPKA